MPPTSACLKRSSCDGRSSCGAVFVDLAARDCVAELLTQQFSEIARQCMRIGLGQLGKLVTPDIQRRTIRPEVGLFGVLVDSEGDELVALAQELLFPVPSSSSRPGLPGLNWLAR